MFQQFFQRTSYNKTELWDLNSNLYFKFYDDYLEAAIPQSDLDSSKGKSGIFTDMFRYASISRKKRSTVEEGSCEEKCKYVRRSKGFSSETDQNSHDSGSVSDGDDNFSSLDDDDKTVARERCMKKCQSERNK